MSKPPVAPALTSTPSTRISVCAEVAPRIDTSVTEPGEPLCVTCTPGTWRSTFVDPVDLLRLDLRVFDDRDRRTDVGDRLLDPGRGDDHRIQLLRLLFLGGRRRLTAPSSLPARTWSEFALATAWTRLLRRARSARDSAYRNDCRQGSNSENRMNSLRVQRLPARGGASGAKKKPDPSRIEGSGFRKIVPEATLPAEGRQLMTRPVSWLGVRPRARLPA